MKKKIALLAVIAMCAAILASGTLAYFTSETTAHNVITSGGIDIKIHETMMWNGEEVPFPSEEFKEENQDTPEKIHELPPVMPSTSMSKIVKVHNMQEKAWIRVKLGVDIQKVGTSGDSPMPEIDKLATTIKMNGKTEDVVQLMFNDRKLSTLANSGVTDDFRWIYHEGYWYCVDPVEKGDMTTALFDEVYFNEKMGNEYQNCTVLIDVEAEAVQVANNNTIEGTNTEIDQLTLENLSNIKGW